jgi:hypothetical protein
MKSTTLGNTLRTMATHIHSLLTRTTFTYITSYIILRIFFCGGKGTGTMHEPLSIFWTNCSIFTKYSYEHFAIGSTYHFSRTGELKKTQKRLQVSLSLADSEDRKCKAHDKRTRAHQHTQKWPRFKIKYKKIITRQMKRRYLNSVQWDRTH